MNIYIVLEVNMEVVCNTILLELVPYYDSIMLYNQGAGFVGAHFSNLFGHKVIKKTRVHSHLLMLHGKHLWQIKPTWSAQFTYYL